MLTRVREKLPKFDKPSTRDFIRNYLPSALIVVCLIILIIIAASFNAALNSCYKVQFASRRDDILLNANQINLILMLNDQDIGGNNSTSFERVQTVSRFIYSKYGRFIRTQVHNQIDVNITVQLDRSVYFDNLQNQLTALAGHDITLSNHTTNSTLLLKDIGSSLRYHLDLNEKRMTIHFVDEPTMTPLLEKFFTSTTPDKFPNALMLLLDLSGWRTDVAMLGILPKDAFNNLLGIEDSG